MGSNPIALTKISKSKRCQNRPWASISRAIEQVISSASPGNRNKILCAAVSLSKGLQFRMRIVDVLNLELDRARLRVKRAEISLNHAKEMLDEECGVGINLALCDRIRSEKKRVAEARKRLMKIASTASA